MKAIGIKNILNQVRMSVASSNASRKSTNHSYKSTKLTTMQRVTPSKQQSRMHFRTISNSNKTQQTVINVNKTSAVTKVSVPSSNLIKGMNDNFLFLRKENHLNTQFMMRKKKLKEITKTNKQIYNRLNSQKSLYSNSDLNKSYESTKQIKQRLSQSKLSHRLNTSQGSSRKSLKVAANGKGIKKVINMQLKAKDINAIDKGEIINFKDLFIRNQHKENLNEKQDFKFDTHRRKQSYKFNKTKNSARLPVAASKEQYNQGGILHRVVQLMKEDEDESKKIRRRSLVMPKNRKLFRF